jgi:penicillin-binding protein 1C
MRTNDLPHAEVPALSEAKDGPRSTQSIPATSGASFEAIPTFSERHVRMRGFGGIGRLAAALLFACLLAAAAPLALKAAVAKVTLPSLNPETSRVIADRSGVLLRAFATSDGRWRLPVTVADVDPIFLKTLFAYEDRRFRDHHGVDVRALFRAAFQLVTRGHPVSGASTITMQVARLLSGETTRSFSGKVDQILMALALEKRLSKDGILDLYLTLAPYGGNVEGIRAASLAYLGKEPRRLTPAEAALLVALPQAPESRRPDRHAEAAHAARDRVIERAAEAGVLTSEDAAAARSEESPDRRIPFPILAPHATSRLVAEAPAVAFRITKIDARLQARLESLATERAAAISDSVSVAILVADHKAGEILASVGSSGLFDERRDGFVDMTRAVRSPGSSLKPLIYGLAFELGVAHPETLIEDKPIDFAGYQPENFDRTFRGTVSVRRALQLSLNVPAIELLEAVGPARLVARMRRAGADPVLPDISPPGLAVGLGGVGVTLTDLVAIDAAIARGGLAVPLTFDLDRPPVSAVPAKVLDERAAWYVASILAGAPGPDHVSPGSIAFKTGTSYGYRDAWAVGFDGSHVIGVWVGRPDGAPVPGLIGIDAAAPILMDAFARLGPTTPLRAAPPGILETGASALPGPLRRFRSPNAPTVAAAVPPEITYPPRGVRVDLGIRAGDPMPLVLKAREGSPPYTWFVDGAPIGTTSFGGALTWEPIGPGFLSLMVIDAQGASSTSTVFVE